MYPFGYLPVAAPFASKPIGRTDQRVTKASKIGPTSVDGDGDLGKVANFLDAREEPSWPHLNRHEVVRRGGDSPRRLVCEELD
jgi:hypothetical protein